MRRESLSDASRLNSVVYPRRLKKLLEALRGAQRPLTAHDLSIICDLTIHAAARFVLTLKTLGYPIHTSQRNNHHSATEYRLVAASPTPRG